MEFLITVRTDCNNRDAVLLIMAGAAVKDPSSETSGFCRFDFVFDYAV